jgi:hypothetical protein
MSKCVIDRVFLVLAATIGVIGALQYSLPVMGEPLAPSGENLAINASFEQTGAGSPVPAGWHGPAQVYSLDSSVARIGKASLKYVNRDSRRYVLCTQKVPLRAGWKCRFGVWIKTQGIAGDESGATICLEWQGKDGKWLGGAYPAGVKGTRDWTRVESVTRLPEDAVSCNVACYVRQGMTGTAWFDDVEVVRIADPPMQSVLVAPVYRGLVTAAGPKEARVRVRWNLVDYDLKPEDIHVGVSLLNAEKRILREASGQPERLKKGHLDLAVPLADLEPGPYDLAVRLTGPGGKELQADHHRIVRLAHGPTRKCYIDENRRLLVDGKPFFPIGMYWSGIKAADLEIYAQSKFNCLMPYGSPTRQQMDLAQKHGLKVIYSIKDWYAGSEWCPPSIRTPPDEEPMVRARVREYRGHPALLAWYLNDELSQQFMPQLETHQRWVAEEDPDHPTWVVLYQFREVAAYLKTFDVIGTDPYPIGRQPASMAAQWSAETFRQVEGARPMWQVPQVHNWGNYTKSEAEKKRGRTPTYDEVRSMAWQCICEGATGLVFYSWFDLKRNPDVPFTGQWEGLKRLAAEVDRMAPILLSIEPAPAVRLEGNRPRWLHWLARSHAGKLYLMAVNDGDGAGPVLFRLPATPKSIRLLGEDRPIPSQSDLLQVDLPRLSVQCYEIELP